MKKIFIMIVVIMSSSFNAYAAPKYYVDNQGYVHSPGLSAVPQWYGAKGDGVTDDTNAFIQALNAGSLYIPAGVYSIGTITVPSNRNIKGEGINSILKAKNALNNPMLKLSNNSNIVLDSFKMEGNSANQTTGDASAITCDGCSHININRVDLNDFTDWGFGFYWGHDATISNSHVTNFLGGVNSSSVRAGFLFGVSFPTVSSFDDVLVTGCSVTGGGTWLDGFMSEAGNNHKFISNSSAVLYTNYKIKGDNTTVQGNYAAYGRQGFQTQAAIKNLSMIANIAYRNMDSGFYFNNNDTSTTAKNWLIANNQSIENGQSPASSSYGYAFESSPSTTINTITLIGNQARDSQTIKTQSRGISIGSSGSLLGMLISNNIMLGNTVDLMTDSVAFDKSTSLITRNLYTTKSGPGNIENSFPKFKAVPFSDQTITSGLLTKVTLTTESIDTESMFASSTFTPTQAGYYQLFGSLYVTGTTITSAYVRINKNGSLIAASGGEFPATTTSVKPSVPAIEYANGTTDYFDLEVYTTGTGTIKVLSTAGNTQFSGALLP